jgi:hypothetical protein
LTVTSVGGSAGVTALGNVTLKQKTQGGITVSGDVKATGGANSSVTLEVLGGAGGIAVAGGAVSGNTVYFKTAGGAVSQSGGTVKDGGGYTRFATNGGAISLTSGSNDFSGVYASGAVASLSVTDANDVIVDYITTSAGGSATVKAAGAITLGSDSQFSVTNGYLYAGTGIGTSASAFSISSTSKITASTNSGGVYLYSSAAPVTIQGITAGSGDIVVTNYGGITTTGLVSTGSGAVTMTANSPLTVGSGGVSATGNITLTANSTGDMLLNGPIKSSLGSVTLSASGGTLTQNSSVYGAKGVTATASSMVYGTAATTSNAPVSYTAGGTGVTPPLDPIATATTSGALLTTFEDLLTAAVEEQALDTQIAQQDETKDPLASESGGEICLR